MKKLKLEVIFGVVNKLSPTLKIMISGSKSFNKVLRETQKELNTLQRQTKLIDAFRKLKSETDTARQKLTHTQKAIKALQDQLKQGSNPQLTAELKRLQQEANKLKNTINKNTPELLRLRRELNQAGLQSTNLAQHQQTLAGRISQTTDRVRQQSEQLRRLNQIQQQTAKTHATAQKMGQAGSSMVMGGAGMAYVLAKPINEAKHAQTEQTRIASLGFGDKTNKEAIAYARALKTFGTSTLQNMELLRDGITAFADLHHAEMVTPYLAKMKFANTAMYGVERAADNERVFMDMLKVIEMRNGLKDEKTFMRQADMIQQVVTATGGRVNATEWLNAIKTGGIAVKGLDDKALYHYMEPIVQEMGGFRYGTAAMSAYQNLYQGRTTKRAANNLVRLGLIADPSKLEHDKAGQVTHLDVGAIKGADLFKKNQFAWMEEVLLPALAKKGITERGEVLDAIGSIFTNRTAAGLFSTMYDQRQQILKNAKLNAGVDGIEELYLKTKDTTAGQELEAKAKLSDAFLALGEHILPIYTQALITAANAMQNLTSWMQRNPTLAKALGLSLLGIATGLVALGGLLVVFSPLLISLASLRLTLTTLPMAWTAATTAGSGFMAIIPMLKGGIMGLGKVLMTTGKLLITNPIVLAIVAIATAVGVAAYMIYKHWDSIAPKATQLWQDVKNAFDAGKNYLTNTWQTIKNGATDIWDLITQGVSSGIERIKQIIIGIDTIFAENPLLNLLIPFIGIPRMIIANWKEIGGFFTGLWATITGQISTAWHIVQDITRSVWANITGTLRTMWANITNTARSYFNQAKSAITGAWQAVSTFTSSVWNTIKNVVSGAWQAICRLFYNIVPINGIRQAFNNVLNYLSGLKDSFFTKGKQIIDGLIGGLEKGFSKLKSIWEKINSYMPSFMAKKMDIHSPSRLFKKFGGYIMQGLDIGLTKGFPTVKKTYKAIHALLMGDAFKYSDNKMAIGSPYRPTDLMVGNNPLVYTNFISPAPPKTLMEKIPNEFKKIPLIGDHIIKLAQKAQTLIDDTKQAGQKVATQAGSVITKPIIPINVGGDTINISIEAAAHMSVHDIAKQIEQVLFQRERKKQAQWQDSYMDYQ